MISRRGFLVIAGLGAAGATGLGAGMVEAGVLPGKVRLDRVLGRCGDAPVPPEAHAAVARETFWSAARGRRVGLTLITPQGQARELPVVIAMHGLGGNDQGVLGHHLDRFLAQAVADGTPPFVIAAVDGGSTYWHRRASGDDPQQMIVQEVLPLLERRGLHTSRIGVLGWSMGGYGALLLGRELGASRVAAIVASAPAVFDSYETARKVNRHAFDGPADFRRYDVLAETGLARLRPIPAWVDCGRSDPFAEVTGRIRARLDRPAGGLSGGCHDGAYWQRQAPAQLAFLGRRLAEAIR